MPAIRYFVKAQASELNPAYASDQLSWSVACSMRCRKYLSGPFGHCCSYAALAIWLRFRPIAPTSARDRFKAVAPRWATAQPRKGGFSLAVVAVRCSCNHGGRRFGPA